MKRETLNSFLLSWNCVEDSREFMAWEACAPYGVSFRRDGMLSIFRCEVEKRDPDNGWRDESYGTWSAMIDGGEIELGLDDLPHAIAVCEARLVEWLAPAIFREDAELNSNALELLESLGGKLPYTVTHG